jgi:hypothetical protein
MGIKGVESPSTVFGNALVFSAFPVFRKFRRGGAGQATRLTRTYPRPSRRLGMLLRIPPCAAPREPGLSPSRRITNPFPHMAATLHEKLVKKMAKYPMDSQSETADPVVAAKLFDAC